MKENESCEISYLPHIYFIYRQATKDEGVTGQTQVGNTIAPTPGACSDILIRTWINKCLAENRKGKQALVIPLTQEGMIMKEPTRALQGEPDETKLFPKVSYNDVDKCFVIAQLSYIAQVETKERVHILNNYMSLLFTRKTLLYFGRQQLQECLVSRELFIKPKQQQCLKIIVLT